VSRSAGSVLGNLHRLFHQGTVAGLAEGKLLEQFIADRDEAAFAALVARHGPMVLGVCRRILCDETDVEDAFQATFLILVRRAAAIRDSELLAGWLHGVAHRVAVRARAQSARRRRYEPGGIDLHDLPAREPATYESDLRSMIDEELAGLPGPLRLPVVLCYLEGLTHDEAARKLHWPVGTVRSRMARARSILRRRLARRGISADGGALTVALARPPIGAALGDSTARASMAFSTKNAATATAVSATAAALAQGALHTMTISKLMLLALTAIALLVAAAGAPSLARQLGVSASLPVAGQPPGAQPKKADRRADLLRSIDKIDDIFDDIERRNRTLQDEIRALRKEIASLSTGEKQERPDERQLLAQPGGADFGSAQFKGKVPIEKAAGTTAPGSANVGGMGAQPGSEPAPGGSTAKYFTLGQGILIVVASQNGDRVAAYNTVTRNRSFLRLRPAGDGEVWVHPVSGGELTALASNRSQLDRKAPVTTRIAALCHMDTREPERWYPLELREPVETAQPVVMNGIAVYVLGRYVYAFSASRRSWDVLELPARPQGEAGGMAPTLNAGAEPLSIRDGNHLYLYSKLSGKWRDVNFDTMLEGQAAEKAAKPE
jgi:RNA polymerase sigma factor (sigma-70 family)